MIIDRNKVEESIIKHIKNNEWFNLNDIYEDAFKAGVSFAEYQLSELAIEFLDAIREYERENGQRICFDERDSKELFQEFLKNRDEKI